MLKKIDFKILDKIINISVLIICVLAIVFKIANNTCLGIILLFINTYMLIKYRNNKLLFLALLMVLYFNYSFCIIKYIGTPANLLDNIYNQLYNYNSTMHIGIVSQILLLVVINIILDVKIDININKDRFKIFNNINTEIIDKKKIVIFLQIILLIILFYHVAMKIDYNTAIFEYSIFLFVFAFYFAKDNKKSIRITELILIFFSIYSILCGERIAVLQFLIVDFIMNYMEKMQLKIIITLILAGIIFFTIAGLYGDFLDYNFNFEDFTIEYILNVFKERRFALDTSVSAYFSGLSMIDLKGKYGGQERIVDMIIYLTKYTALGSKANYITPEIRVQEYQVNYGGGFLTSYFYFWAEWIGVILISSYIGFLFRNINKKVKSDYLEMLSVLIVAMLPRWFLYVPTFLFRGIILYTIIYILLIIFNNRIELKRYVVKKGKIINERRKKSKYNSTNL